MIFAGQESLMIFIASPFKIYTIDKVMKLSLRITKAMKKLCSFTGGRTSQVGLVGRDFFFFFFCGGKNYPKNTKI